LAVFPIFVAVDDGPQQTLEPLAAHWSIAIADCADPAAVDDSYWEQAIKKAGASVLFCGTSDSSRGREIEPSARRAAAKAGIATVAIEDYPGNYRDVASAHTAMLVVESELVAKLVRSKLGQQCPLVAVVSPPRYDAYRQQAHALRQRVRLEWCNRSRGRPSVLWAGQPETADSLATLRALLPAFRSQRVGLLFKAHPRDPGYRAGAYSAVLEGLPWRDVTALSVSDALALAPQLVVTQFSSVAIEAGFYGIPSLGVLLPNAGGARLLEKKGYPVPPYCEYGATALADSVQRVEREFSSTLCDETRRARIIRCFDDYFHTSEIMLPKLVAKFEANVTRRGISP
jgi:hypothetical protein